MAYLVTTLNQGYSWNPLKKHPRNSPCPCGSQKKFKKCHLDLLPEAITTQEAEKLKRLAKSNDKSQLEGQLP